jgi:hypothetical protein
METGVTERFFDIRMGGIVIHPNPSRFIFIHWEQDTAREMFARALLIVAECCAENLVVVPVLLLASFGTVSNIGSRVCTTDTRTILRLAVGIVIEVATAGAEKRSWVDATWSEALVPEETWWLIFGALSRLCGRIVVIAWGRRTEI